MIFRIYGFGKHGYELIDVMSFKITRKTYDSNEEIRNEIDAVIESFINSLDDEYTMIQVIRHTIALKQDEAYMLRFLDTERLVRK